MPTRKPKPKRLAGLAIGLEELDTGMFEVIAGIDRVNETLSEDVLLKQRKRDSLWGVGADRRDGLIVQRAVAHSEVPAR